MKVRPRKKRSVTELVLASVHLRYELDMFFALTERLEISQNGGVEKPPGEISNAILESYLIHARALLYFFYAKNPFQDDIVAEDFFADENEWHRIRGEKTETLKRVNARVDKEVAHLTYARLEVKPDEKGWKYLEIAKEFEALANRFIDHAPANLLGPEWRAQ